MLFIAAVTSGDIAVSFAKQTFKHLVATYTQTELLFASLLVC